MRAPREHRELEAALTADFPAVQLVLPDHLPKVAIGLGRRPCLESLEVLFGAFLPVHRIESALHPMQV